MWRLYMTYAICKQHLLISSEIWAILEISSQIWVMPVQFEVSQTSVSQQSLRKGFKNVVSRWDRPCIASTSCTRPHFATTRQNHLISKIRKKTMATKTILRCTLVLRLLTDLTSGPVLIKQIVGAVCLFVCLFVVFCCCSFFFFLS